MTTGAPRSGVARRQATGRAPTIRELLRRHLVVCLGPGGVGKTTTAAALALSGALDGRRTAVITFDPSRRLKDALGLDALSVDPHRVDAGDAHFDALALDTKRTFDALIERFAPDQATAARILGNRLYQELSNGLAGSAEYMAMEKLHELAHGRRYRTIVVDTPPSAHARDLLAAPDRLVNLLASRAVSFLKSPASVLAITDSAAGRLTLSALLKALQRWTGLDLLRDLADFVGGFETMVEGFSRRAREVDALLRAPATAFVLVTTPDPHTIRTTTAFHRELVDAGFPVAGVIANRVLGFPALSAADARLASCTEALRCKLLRTYADLRKLSEAHAAALDRLQTETGAPLLAAIPALTDAPATLEGLRRFAERLRGCGKNEFGPLT